jgi:hypothetical protein
VILGPRACLTFWAAALIGCASSEPQPHIDAVEPSQASSDRDVRLTLIGSDFVPSFRLDPTSNEWVAVIDGFSGRVAVASHWAPLTNFGWLGPTQISASLTSDAATDLWMDWDEICPLWKEGIDTCPCDVEITDPRGRKAVLAAGFTETGPDKKGPDLEVESPATNDRYCPGALIHARVKATEQAPRYLTTLTWRYTEPGSSPKTGNCPFEQGSTQVDCTFDILMSSALSQDAKPKLEVFATNDAADQSTWGIVILLDPRPTVNGVIPQSGGMAGGTNVVIDGSGFLPDSRVYFDDVLLNPEGGIYVDEQTITGYTPAGKVPEGVVVKVTSRLGVVSKVDGFHYLDPPNIVSIEPKSGVQDQPQTVKVRGTNFTSTTIIYVGSSLGTARTLDVGSRSSVQISGILPGSRGTATVWAFDETSGWSSLPDGFTWTSPP